MSRALAIHWANLRVAVLVIPYRIVTLAYARALDDALTLQERR